MKVNTGCRRLGSYRGRRDEECRGNGECGPDTGETEQRRSPRRPPAAPSLDRCDLTGNAIEQKLRLACVLGTGKLHVPHTREAGNQLADVHVLVHQLRSSSKSSL